MTLGILLVSIIIVYIISIIHTWIELRDRRQNYFKFFTEFDDVVRDFDVIKNTISDHVINEMLTIENKSVNINKKLDELISILERR